MDIDLERSARDQRAGRDAALRARGGTAARLAAGAEQTHPPHGRPDWRTPAGARLSRRAADRGRAACSPAAGGKCCTIRRRSSRSPERAARGEAGALRIGFGIASILGFLPKVLLRFRRAYPDVLLQLRDMPTPDQVNALVTRSIDIGFVRRPVRDDRLVMRPVLNERLVAALGPRSPVGAQARPGVGRRPSRSSSSRAPAPPASTTTR